jgi:hypothetical protein
MIPQNIYEIGLYTFIVLLLNPILESGVVSPPVVVSWEGKMC